MEQSNPNILRWTIGLAIGGLILLAVGGMDYYSGSGADREPQTLTAAELLKNGPGENRHVILTDFQISVEPTFTPPPKPATYLGKEDAFIPLVTKERAEKLMRDGAAARSKAANPSGVASAGPSGGDYITPTQFRCLVHIASIPGRRGLSRFQTYETMQGMIAKGADVIRPDQFAILKRVYPAVAIEKCYVLEYGERPATPARVWFFLVAGLALLGLAVLVFRRAS